MKRGKKITKQKPSDSMKIAVRRIQGDHVIEDIAHAAGVIIETPSGTYRMRLTREGGLNINKFGSSGDALSIRPCAANVINLL